MQNIDGAFNQGEHFVTWSNGYDVKQWIRTMFPTELSLFLVKWRHELRELRKLTSSRRYSPTSLQAKGNYKQKNYS